MLHGVIYGLHDPHTGLIRYIGQTTTTVEQRLRSHLAPSSLNRHSYVYRWLRGLVGRGLRPTTSIIAEAQDQPELDRLEIEHIAAARDRGECLTNLSDGGGGPFGRIVSPETREKIAAKQRGVPRAKHTDEWRKLMSAKMKGRRTNTAEHMERLWGLRVGKRHTEEAKERIAVAKMGRPSVRLGAKHTDEARARMSASQKGLQAGEQHHSFRHDISTDDIFARLALGKTKVQVAAELGVSPTFVHRRIAQARGRVGDARHHQALH